MMRHRLYLFCISVLLLGASACSSPQSTMNAQGTAAKNIATLGWVVYLLFGIIAAIMWGLIIWIANRRRGTLDEHEPWNAPGNQKWIWYGGFAIPFVVLCGVFVFAMERQSEFPINNQQPVHPQILVVGHQWWWEVQYLGQPDVQFITANEIHIPAGQPIDLELETADVIHSFWVPELHGKVDMIPGQPNFIRIEADHPGSFVGECGEYCGEQHAHMRLMVLADPPDVYERWKANQLKPAPEPSNQEAMHGREVFMNAACSFCHRIRGTQAGGGIAPDLTHLASRQMIGANTFENNTANLEAWSTHAQSMKPGVIMPNLTAFSGTDLRALVAYLEQLK